MLHTYLQWWIIGLRLRSQWGGSSLLSACNANEIETASWGVSGRLGLPRAARSVLREESSATWISTRLTAPRNSLIFCRVGQQETGNCEILLYCNKYHQLHPIITDRQYSDWLCIYHVTLKQLRGVPSATQGRSLIQFWTEF